MKKWFWLGFILLNAVIFGTSAAFHRLGAVIDAAAVFNWGIGVGLMLMAWALLGKLYWFMILDVTAVVIFGIAVVGATLITAAIVGIAIGGWFTCLHLIIPMIVVLVMLFYLVSSIEPMVSREECLEAMKRLENTLIAVAAMLLVGVTVFAVRSALGLNPAQIKTAASFVSASLAALGATVVDRWLQIHNA